MRVLIYLTVFLGVLNASVINTDSKKMSLTIYSHMAMVNETRSFFLKSGAESLILNNIPKMVIADSISPSFEPNINVYSQELNKDTFSYNSLLEKNIGKNILFFDNGVEKNGKLISTSPILIKEGEQIFKKDENIRIYFNSENDKINLFPRLIWKIERLTRNLDLMVNINYLTNGISWKGNYIGEIERDHLILTAWANVKNNSGIDYDDVKLSLLAGEVSSSRPKPIYMRKLSTAEMNSNNVKRKSFSDYHLYKIPFKISLKNNSVKQIKLFNSQKIKFKTYGEINIGNFLSKRNNQVFKVDKIIDFENSKSNNLGLPFPNGVFRIYKKDNGESVYLGESRIQNTSKNENIRLNIGKMFDIKMYLDTVSFKKKNNIIYGKNKISIKNNSNEDKVIKIKGYIPGYKNLKFNIPCLNDCKIKEGQYNKEYVITVSKNSRYIVDVNYEYYQK